MNKQEAIEQINYIDTLSINDKTACQQVDMIIKNQVLDIINQLDEPEKPVVPQFVADWYEKNKNDFEFSVQCLCVHGCDPVRQIDTWFDSVDNKPIETLVMMHKFGYEIEKEKLYTVEIPNPNAGGHVVLCKTSDGIASIAFTGMARWQGCKNFQLTEAEIKEDFAWAFRWAKEV